MATEMKETEMKVTTKTTTKKRFQKKCIECTRSHRCCVFELTEDVQCARCVKFHLTCVFRLSGMISSINFVVFKFIFFCLSKNVISSSFVIFQNKVAVTTY
jgi:hypothetical protein